VLDHVEWIVSGLAGDVDRRHAVSTDGSRWKCTTPLTPPSGAAICRRSNAPPQIDIKPPNQSARTL
jgi:hypothetical protein